MAGCGGCCGGLASGLPCGARPWPRWGPGTSTAFGVCLADHPADLVLSVHPLLNHAPLREVRRRLPGTPFVTVVTDLATAHPVWYAPGVDLLCAPCPEVQQAALAAGVPADRIRLAGLPISLRFSEGRPDRAEARRLLGLADRPTVLIMGGGEGMGRVESIAHAVAAGLQGVNGQAVVICGRNASLQRRLSGSTWPAPVHVLGFVDNMPVWMSAADCLVTKAGPGTIAEALACGLPMVLSDFVPGQEEGNVGYVTRSWRGRFQRQSSRDRSGCAGVATRRKSGNGCHARKSPGAGASPGCVGDCGSVERAVSALSCSVQRCTDSTVDGGQRSAVGRRSAVSGRRPLAAPTSGSRRYLGPHRARWWPVVERHRTSRQSCCRQA